MGWGEMKKDAGMNKQRASEECLVVYGGTFDPIHMGHIHILEHMLMIYQGSRVIIMPNKNPVDKNASAHHHRLSMIELAIDKKPIEISKMELDSQERTSLTINTVKKLREENPGKSIIWIMGDDCLNDIDTWEGGMELINYVHFHIIPRVGLEEKKSLQRMLKRRVKNNISLKKGESGLIFIDEGFAKRQVSGSQIRKDVMKKRVKDDCLTDNVRKYIRENGLYQS